MTRRRWTATAGKATISHIDAGWQRINEQLLDPLDFDDNIAGARVDVRIESLQEERRFHQPVPGKLLVAAEADNKALRNKK